MVQLERPGCCRTGIVAPPAYSVAERNVANGPKQNTETTRVSTKESTRKSYEAETSHGGESEATWGRGLGVTASTPPRRHANAHSSYSIVGHLHLGCCECTLPSASTLQGCRCTVVRPLHWRPHFRARCTRQQCGHASYRRPWAKRRPVQCNILSAPNRGSA